MARDWAKVAAEVVELVGGQENIESVTHCVTRLRFQLKDESVANDEAISAIDGVIQVMHANGQYQVVIGPQVEAAYDAVLALLPSKGAGSVPEDDADAANKSIKDKLMDIISGVFLPMIDAMSAAGLIVGPVANTLSNLIAQGLLAILNVAPAIGGAAIAFAWPFLIIFGMHWGLIPVMMANFGTLGYDFIMPLTVGTNFAVGAVLLAVFLKTKKKDLKDTCIETLAPAWLAGVTEPGIYGVLLRFNRTFICMALGCAVAGAIGGIASLHQTVFLTASVLTLPALFGDMGIWQVVQALAAIVVAFVLTYLFGYNDEMAE